MPVVGTDAALELARAKPAEIAERRQALLQQIAIAEATRNQAADALAELAVAANLAGDRKTAGLLARKATAINATDPRFRALAREFADA